MLNVSVIEMVRYHTQLAMHSNHDEIQHQTQVGESKQDVYSRPGAIRPNQARSGVRVSASRAQLQLAGHGLVVPGALLAQVHVGRDVLVDSRRHVGRPHTRLSRLQVHQIR